MPLPSLPIVTPASRQTAARDPASPKDKGSYALVSLGCPKNLVDSERMAGLLQMDGYQLVREPDGADFVVINTCGFIATAREESFGAIDEMLAMKRAGQVRGVIVAGCLAEREREALLQRYPDVDQVVGVFGRDDIARAADRLLGGLNEQRAVFRPAPTRALPDTHRLRVTPRHLAYLKISEGCNRTCTFCAIPKMRGKHASKPLDEVLAEAHELAADGVRELIVIGQDTSYYGVDWGGGAKLAELLTQLDTVPGIEWIRLMYLYPTHVNKALVDVMASARKIIPYLDMPLQHINDDILRNMRRGVTRARTVELLDELRSGIPNLVLRTTFIAGFPGETKAQFQELVEFVRQQAFDRLGAFAYSVEPGTPAAELENQVPENARQKRRERLLAVQQEIAFARNAAQVGRRLDVLLDSVVPEQPGAYVGRTYADAPEIDGVVYVTGEALQPGQIVACEIVGSQGYDLIGVAVEDPR